MVMTDLFYGAVTCLDRLIAPTIAPVQLTPGVDLGYTFPPFTMSQ